MIGKTILHYRIIEKLGEGGMGVVYKAEDTKLKREVAIKFLPHHIQANDEERERMKIEAQAAASLNHQNIATIHAIEETADELFIVMEYIEGQELKGKIALTNLNIEDVHKIALQIADGLHAAHEKGIVHRDIKSSNIMMTSKGQVKIMDFGLAKLSGGPQLTQKDSTMGTISYMSPEQTKGTAVDHRSDLFSFGVVFYELLTGNKPFAGDSMTALLYAVTNTEYVPLNEIAPKTPPGCVEIIDRLLARGVSKRYQSATQVIKEIQLCLETLN